MLIVGLTGGMGAGKTTVAQIFEKIGVPVYYADNRAKELMQKDQKLKNKIKSIFGEKTYISGKLNSKYLAGIVFANKKKLKELESLVHPVVIRDFKKWIKKQKTSYIIVENAVLHKSGMDKLVNLIIFVKLNEEDRIKRIQKRDHLIKEDIKKRLKNQDKDDFLLKKSDIVIENNSSLDDLIENVEKIDENIKSMLKKR